MPLTGAVAEVRLMIHMCMAWTCLGLQLLSALQRPSTSLYITGTFLAESSCHLRQLLPLGLLVQLG